MNFQWVQNLKEIKEILTGIVKIYNEISNEESLDVSVREEITVLKRVLIALKWSLDVI